MCMCILFLAFLLLLCCFFFLLLLHQRFCCLESYALLALPLFEFELVLMCVPCMLPVWLFGRWRKPERKRHVCFSFQFIITRYFYDHERSLMWCVCCALHRIDNTSVWIWTALSNYRRIWSKSFLAIFGRVLHTHTRTQLCLIFFVFISSSSFSIRQTRHLLASMSNIFHSLMGILLHVLFWENSEMNKIEIKYAWETWKIVCHFWQGWMSAYRDLTWLVDVMYRNYLCCLSLGADCSREIDMVPYNWQASLCLPLYD